MSDHVWALENIAAYLAGGLDPTEGERLEQHAAQCAVCARDLDEGRALERKLAPLFRRAKPGPALEDRIIQALLMARPAGARRRAYHLPWQAKTGLAVAAALLLAFIGFGVSRMIEEDRLGFPPAGSYATISLGTGTMAEYEKDKELRRLATTYYHSGGEKHQKFVEIEKNNEVLSAN